MSSSIAIKNTVLALLLLLIVHVTMRNAILTRVEDDTSVTPVDSSPSILRAVDVVAVDPPLTSASTITSSTTKNRDALWEYVFLQDDGIASPPIPQPRKPVDEPRPATMPTSSAAPFDGFGNTQYTTSFGAYSPS
jgi:hypothetical protein